MLSELISVLRPKTSVSHVTLILIKIYCKAGFVGRIMMKGSVTQ
jgi:hypothetical protein